MLQAISDRIIIELDSPKTGNLLLPENKALQNSGIVKSIGDKVTWVKNGDHVVFHLFDELPLPEENLVVIRESSILGIYTD